MAMFDGVLVQYRHGLYNSSSPERRHNPSIEDFERVSKDVAVRLMVKADFRISSANEHSVSRPSSDEASFDWEGNSFTYAGAVATIHTPFYSNNPLTIIVNGFV